MLLFPHTALTRNLNHFRRSGTFWPVSSFVVTSFIFSLFLFLLDQGFPFSLVVSKLGTPSISLAVCLHCYLLGAESGAIADFCSVTYSQHFSLHGQNRGKAGLRAVTCRVRFLDVRVLMRPHTLKTDFLCL